MKKTFNSLNQRRLMNMAVPWGCAFLFLVFYYIFIQFPMERSFIRGLHYLQQDKLVEASKEFGQVLTVYPKYEPIFLNISNYHLQNKRFKESNYYYNYARRICFINSEIFLERGMVYSKYQRNLKEGITFYNEHVMKYYLSSLFYPHEKE